MPYLPWTAYSSTLEASPSLAGCYYNQTYRTGLHGCQSLTCSETLLVTGLWYQWYNGGGGRYVTASTCNYMTSMRNTIEVYQYCGATFCFAQR